ncbi:MAG: hypothetical protein NTX50_03555 [Candidatus Sumerlaeota bacterium]|nr:hypothetical protein [Candidatus Sumerlaeota bacterium]
MKQPSAKQLFSPRGARIIGVIFLSSVILAAISYLAKIGEVPRYL